MKDKKRIEEIKLHMEDIMEDTMKKHEKLKNQEYKTYQETGSDIKHNENRIEWINKISNIEEQLTAIDEVISWLEEKIN